MTNEKWQEYPQPPRYVMYSYDTQWMASVTYDAEHNNWIWKVFDPEHQMRCGGTEATPGSARISAENCIVSNLKDK